MMKRNTGLCVAILGLLLWGASENALLGAGPADVAGCAKVGCSPTGACAACPKGGCRGACPDDYCEKPAPCYCLPPICGCCDSYCPKPAPCYCLPPICGGCDNYCPKPAPCVSRPCGWPAFYKCPPPLRCCPSCTAAKKDTACCK